MYSVHIAYIAHRPYIYARCELLEVRGDLSISVENKKSSRVDRQACKHYALTLTLCAFNNSKSI